MASDGRQSAQVEGKQREPSGGGGQPSSSTVQTPLAGSVLIDYGMCGSSCGYCKSSASSSIIHGMLAKKLTASDYQDLLDQGWRRSGCFLYKPEMETTCCPQYTIRLKVDDFSPSKEQARVLKKMQRFLDYQLNYKNKNAKFVREGSNHTAGNPQASSSHAVAETRQPLSKEESLMNILSVKLDNAIHVCFPLLAAPKVVVKKANSQLKKKVSTDLLYMSTVSFQISASIKRIGSADLVQDADGSVELNPSPHSIAEKLAKAMESEGDILGISVKAYDGHLNFYGTKEDVVMDDNSLDASSRASIVDNGCSKQSSASSSAAPPPHKRRKLEIRMKRSSFDPVEFALYKKYQAAIHSDKNNTKSSYSRFLVETPIVFVPPREDDDSIPPCGFGSFHQQYLIDGKLVAVGVVDILPRCLSSKYFFWEPDLAFLSLGKYSALQEISWIKDTQVHCPSLQYYYLGYYIHSCPKMRYKATYRPSQLLCPARYQWVPFDVAKPLLDKSPYVALSDFYDPRDRARSLPPSGSSVDVDLDESLDCEEDETFEYNQEPVLPGK